MPYARDPVSLLWDRAAAHALAQAYAAKGGWYSTRVKDPTPVQVERFAALGIHVLGRDNAATRSGKRMNARSRWCRGFVRALYYQNGLTGKRPIEVELGAHKPELGVIPAGRAIRVRVRRGGSAAQAAVRKKAEADRIYDNDGAAAGRWADPAGRDW